MSYQRNHKSFHSYKIIIWKNVGGQTYGVLTVAYHYIVHTYTGQKIGGEGEGVANNMPHVFKHTHKVLWEKNVFTVIGNQCNLRKFSFT